MWPNTCLCLSRLSSCLLSRLSSCLARTALDVSECTRHRVAHVIVWLPAGDKALVATIAKLAAVPLNLVQIDKVEWDDATDRVLVSVSLKVVLPPLFSSLLPCLFLPWSLGVLDGLLDAEHRCRAPKLLPHPGPGRPSSLAHLPCALPASSLARSLAWPR
jgi:hypothetical protein